MILLLETMALKERVGTVVSDKMEKTRIVAVNEFVFHNNSVYKKSLKSEIWDNQDKMHSLEQWKKIEAKFPEFVTVLGTDGGFRDHVKVRVKWRKAYRSSQVRNLKSLF